MKKVARELLGVLVSAIMFLQFPIYALAGGTYHIEDGDISVHATDSGQRVEQGGQEYVDNDPVITNEGNAASDNHVSITADAGSIANVTISDVSIASSVAAIQTDGDGSVEIKLVGDNHVTSGDTYAGIEKGNNGSLTISSGSSNAYLEATGGRRGAGIGGHDGQHVDDIIITGGNITAEGGQYAAGIGGGYGGDGTGITISGGYVYVLGGGEGAGIGGGRDGSGSDITITGGTVVADGIEGAGIGGGKNGSGSDITITGGTVTAEAVGTGAAIGGGDHGSGSDITITGGTVVADGGREGHGTEIFITGGNVYATGVYDGAGIGGGRQGNGANISISGGTVISVSDVCGAGIGGGRNGNGADISVSNSAKVMVAGGECVFSGVDYHGAGIGSGMQLGTDIINGEEVNPNISRLYDSVAIAYYPPGTTIDDIRMGNVRPIRTLPGLLYLNGETDDAEVKEVMTSSKEFAAFLEAINAKLEAFINKAEELKASGDTEGLNALISKGVSLETGNWVCFNKETYTLIQKISDLGAPVTISFVYKGHGYVTVIPVNAKTKPLDLCNEEGYCGFMNLIKHYGGIKK